MEILRRLEPHELASFRSDDLGPFDVQEGRPSGAIYVFVNDDAAMRFGIATLKARAAAVWPDRRIVIAVRSPALDSHRWVSRSGPRSSRSADHRAVKMKSEG